jgi:hypothetical protein
MKSAKRRIDVNLAELDQVLDSALEAPLSEADHDKLKDTLHAMAALLVRTRKTEKSSEGGNPRSIACNTPSSVRNLRASSPGKVESSFSLLQIISVRWRTMAYESQKGRARPAAGFGIRRKLGRKS